MARLIIGCGYLGRRVANGWIRDRGNPGSKVYAYTRSQNHARQLEGIGVTPLIGDVIDRRTLEQLPEVATILYAVGYDRGQAASMREVYVEGLRNVLSVVTPSIERLIYISSTGVYGQTAGEWVDEDSPCRPTREGGKICLEAENVLRNHRIGEKAIIMRMAGIYGPGRVPYLSAMKQGAPIAAAEAGWLNLIHVDDAARIVQIAETTAQNWIGPRTYIVSDGSPVIRGDYYRAVASLAGACPPEFTSPAEGSHAPKIGWARSDSSKRCCNKRMIEELSIRLQYPDYRSGLTAILNPTTSDDR